MLFTQKTIIFSIIFCFSAICNIFIMSDISESENIRKSVLSVIKLNFRLQLVRESRVKPPLIPNYVPDI